MYSLTSFEQAKHCSRSLGYQPEGDIDAMFLENATFKTNAMCNNRGKVSDGFIEDMQTSVTLSIKDHQKRLVYATSCCQVTIARVNCICSIIKRTFQNDDSTNLIGVFTCSGTPPSRIDIKVEEEWSIAGISKVSDWRSLLECDRLQLAVITLIASLSCMHAAKLCYDPLLLLADYGLRRIFFQNIQFHSVRKYRISLLGMVSSMNHRIDPKQKETRKHECGACGDALPSVARHCNTTQLNPTAISKITTN